MCALLTLVYTGARAAGADRPGRGSTGRGGLPSEEKKEEVRLGRWEWCCAEEWGRRGLGEHDARARGGGVRSARERDAAGAALPLGHRC
jgi:hypothetical protein